MRHLLLFTLLSLFVISCKPLPSEEEAQDLVQAHLTRDNKPAGKYTVVRKLEILSIAKDSGKVKIRYKWDGDINPPALSPSRIPEVMMEEYGTLTVEQ